VLAGWRPSLQIMPNSPGSSHQEGIPHDDAAGVSGRARDYYPGGRGPSGGVMRILLTPATWVFFIALALAYWAGNNVSPVWVLERVVLEVHQGEDGSLYYVSQGNNVPITDVVPIEDSPLNAEAFALLNREGGAPPMTSQIAVEAGDPPVYYSLNAKRHWRYWSLLPALVAVVLCWITREPLTSLFGGIVIGAFILTRYNLTEDVLVKSLANTNAVGILILYLWLLGGLLGIWAKTGAAQAFARMMARHFVRGPRSAKTVAWILGLVFHQGGTMSAALVGTTVKSLSDENKVSHEELSYIVDSTASPVAGIIPFNAWPAYVAQFTLLPGVAYLATEADRISFFFKSIPYSFYCIFAVLGTFLMCIDKAPILGRRMRTAIKRARETGQLDAPGSTPLSAKELEVSTVPEGYKPHPIDFLLPLITLIGIVIGTYYGTGSPQVRWAFGAAVIVAMALALVRGMTLLNLMDGLIDGMKGVVLGSVILLLAVVIGTISQQTGGGLYLVDLIGQSIPYWSLPVLLMILTIIIAFSTGTSWGTYAVTFPLAMPLAWAIAHGQGLDHPDFYLLICFASVLNGAICGDQCSPISDTTVLSSMCTGTDLMDHVKTQLVPAIAAAVLAGICWTVVVLQAA
jgi:Na+/H+ antiporter NhaC